MKVENVDCVGDMLTDSLVDWIRAHSCARICKKCGEYGLCQGCVDREVSL